MIIKCEDQYEADPFPDQIKEDASKILYSVFGALLLKGVMSCGRIQDMFADYDIDHLIGLEDNFLHGILHNGEYRC